MNYSYIDYINMLDLAINLQNFRSNKQQEINQNTEDIIDQKLNSLVEEIHSHLQEQDEKINKILNILEVTNNDH